MHEWGDALPVLSADRLVLRPLRAGDVPALFEVFSDAEVMRYWSTAPFGTEAEARELLRRIDDGFRARSLFQWGVARRSDDLVIGTCTLFRLERAHRRAELGFALSRREWGQGLGSQAVRRLIAFAFDTLDLFRLEADVDPNNERSLRLLGRLGFRREGHLRARYHIGGEVQDAVMLGLLRSDWPPPA
jgi:[ribosomal protein S5]-alanine N-acetyltransferase